MVFKDVAIDKINDIAFVLDSLGTVVLFSSRFCFAS